MLPYAIENITGAERVWMKGDLAPYGTNVYILKKTVGYSADASKIFDFFSDFDTLDAGVWETVAGTPAVADSVATLTGTGTESIRSLSSFSPETIFEARLHHDSGNTGFWGFYNTSALPYTAWAGGRTTYTTDYNYNSNGTNAGYATDNVDRSGDTFYVYGIAYLNGQTNFSVNYEFRRSITTYAPSGAIPIAFSSIANKTMSIDWVRTRKYAVTEPTVDVFDEGDNYKIVVKNNVNSILRDYQFSFMGADIGGIADSQSFSIVPIMQSPINVLYRLFDGCTMYYDGKTTDVTGLTTATASGAVSTTNRFGAVDGALYFDGVNDKLTISPGAVDMSGDFTVFIILSNYTATGTGRDILCCRGGTGNLGFDLGLATATDTPYFNLDTGDNYWNGNATGTVSGVLYFAGQRSNTTLQLFINGVADYSRSTYNTNLTQTANLYLGCSYTGASYFYNGKVEAVIAWNRALSANEHKLLYELFKTRYIYPINYKNQQRGL